MKTINRLLTRASFLLRPEFWIRVKTFSAPWDVALNKMLDAPVFEKHDSHTVLLNGKQIWVSNWPQAYGAPYEWAPDVLPRRETQVRLRKALEHFYFENAK